MSTATRPSPSTRTEIARFDRTERIVHWVTATLVILLMATGAAMYAGPISEMVGRRDLVRNVHVIAGLALPIPIVFALLARRRGAALRRDVRELNRSSVKFNVGQRLNAAFLVAAGVVLFGTGIMLKWYEWFSVDLRTGATFVHDWFAIGLWFAVVGHIVFALRDPGALLGMWRGVVSASWARRAHPRWYERVTGESANRFKAKEPADPDR